MRQWSHKEIEIWAQWCEGCLEQALGDSELAANGAAPNGVLWFVVKTLQKQKRIRLCYKMNYTSLKEVTLEGKWFGFLGDRWSFLCVTRWTLGYGSLGHIKHTWKVSSRFYTCDIIGSLATSRPCVVLSSVTVQWGCQDRPTWCGRGTEIVCHGMLEGCSSILQTKGH